MAKHAGPVERRGRSSLLAAGYKFRGEELDSRLISLMIHAAAVAFCLCIFFLTDRPEIVLQAGGLIILATYAWLTVREGKDAPLSLSPASVFFAWFSIGYGLATFWAGKRVGEGELVPFSTVFLDPRTLGPGFLICIIGALALHVGMHLSRPPQSPEAIPTFGRLGTRGAAVLLVIWGLAFVLRVFPQESKLLGGLAGIIQWGGLSSLCLYALTQGRRRSRPRFFWPILLGGSALEMLLNLNGGSKAFLMFSFLPFIWLAVSEKKFKSWMIPLSLAFGSVYFLLVWPVVTQARTVPRKDNESTAALTLRVFLSESRDDVDLTKGREEFLYRQLEAAPTSFIYGEVERYGFQYGNTMDYLGFGLVPRVLWPEKPAVNRGRWFDTYIAHNTSEGDPGNCLGQSAAGELYWNFGWPGVAVGMLVLGVLVGRLWRIATPLPTRSPIRMLLYIQLSVLMISFADAGVAFLGLTQRLIVFGALFWMMAYWRGRKRALRMTEPRQSALLVLGTTPLGGETNARVRPGS